MANRGGVDYKANQNGVVTEIRCPLVNDWIEDIECIETRDVADEMFMESSLPERFRAKEDWRGICLKCPFHDY